MGPVQLNMFRSHQNLNPNVAATVLLVVSIVAGSIFGWLYMKYCMEFVIRVNPRSK